MSPFHVIDVIRVSIPCQCGVIEVVPDSKSRDQIGKQTQVSLKDYFHSMYGPDDSIPYQEVHQTLNQEVFVCIYITRQLPVKIYGAFTIRCYNTDQIML